MVLLVLVIWTNHNKGQSYKILKLVIILNTSLLYLKLPHRVPITLNTDNQLQKLAWCNLESESSERLKRLQGDVQFFLYIFPGCLIFIFHKYILMSLNTNKKHLCNFKVNKKPKKKSYFLVN